MSDENQNNLPSGKLKVETSKAGRKYFKGYLYVDGACKFVRVTKRKEKDDKGYEYTVWLEDPAGQRRTQQGQVMRDGHNSSDNSSWLNDNSNTDSVSDIPF